MSQITLRLFKIVSNHLLRQGGPCKDNGYCKYSGKDNRSCAVGCLIMPAFYLPEMEGKPADHPAVRKAVALSMGVEGIETRDIEMMLELQTIHDREDPTQWVERLNVVARRYGMEVNGFDVRIQQPQGYDQLVTGTPYYGKPLV